LTTEQRKALFVFPREIQFIFPGKLTLYPGPLPSPRKSLPSSPQRQNPQGLAFWELTKHCSDERAICGRSILFYKLWTQVPGLEIILHFIRYVFLGESLYVSGA
jgi:hypothetical protein